MKREPSVEQLETSETVQHQRREWRLERAGWIAMLLVVLAALAGLLGPGPLTSGEVSNADALLTLEYNAVEHYEAPGRFVIRARGTSGASTLRLLVSRSFCDRTTAESIVPRPVLVEIRNDDVLYDFAIPSSAAAVVTYRYTYNDFGTFDHRIAIEGGAPIEFRQCVLP